MTPLDQSPTFRDPITFRYPARIEGYIDGVSLGRNVGYGAVSLVTRRDGSGEGDVVRRGVMVGSIVRHPVDGWHLLDLAGNVVGFNARQVTCASMGGRSLPDPAEQASCIAASAWRRDVGAVELIELRSAAE